MNNSFSCTRHSPIHFLFVLASFVTFSHAWTFTTVEHGQCGPLTVTWSGGKGPFHVSIHAIAGSGRRIPVPESAFTNGQGSIEITLQVPAGNQFLVSMGDADGLLTGGTSALLTASAQRDGQADCDYNLARPDFFWSADAAENVKQCQPYPFTGVGTDESTTSTFKRPTTLLVLIPGGDESFTVEMPDAPSFAWVVNVAAGKQVLFDMTDSVGNQGGVGHPYTVQSGSTSCALHDASDKSTSTASPDATSSTQPTGSNSGFSLTTGALIGIIVGALALIGLLGLVVFLLLRRRNRDKERRKYQDKPLNLLSYPDGVGYTDELDHPRAQSYYMDGSRQSHNLDAPPRQSQHFDGAQTQYYNPWGAETGPYTANAGGYAATTTSSSTGAPPSATGSSRLSAYSNNQPPAPYQSKHRLSYQPPQQRVIQHADIADAPPPPEEPELPVELPPQYSDTRAPLSQFAELTPGQSPYHGTGASSSSVAPSTSGTNTSWSGRAASMKKGPR